MNDLPRANGQGQRCVRVGLRFNDWVDMKESGCAFVTAGDLIRDTKTQGPKLNPSTVNRSAG